MPVTLVRPGNLIWRVLTGQTPIRLFAGDTTLVAVDRASLTQLHRAYMAEVKLARTQSLHRASRQSGMSYGAFKKYVWMAKRLGFIAEVERGDPVYPSLLKPDLTLLLVPEGAGAGTPTIQSAPRLLALTDAGLAAGPNIWTDLARIYAESQHV